MSSTDNCTSLSPQCPVEKTVYGYAPSLASNSAFLAIFATCTVLQLWLGLWKRTWTYSGVLFFGCLAESIGYVGRLILHSNPWSDVGFEMQICCLIMAPAFLAAGIYLILKYLVLTFGPENSQIKPRHYTWFFISADFLSLLLQAIGGGLAASAKTNQNRDIGTNIMITGIVWQVFTLVVFAALTANFFVRVYRARSNMTDEGRKAKQSLKFRGFLVAITIAYIAIFIRCVYRIPEMTGGWASPLMRDELTFEILDGFMCSLAAVLLTAFHPGVCFPIMTAEASKEARRLDPTTNKGSKSSVSETDVKEAV